VKRDLEESRVKGLKMVEDATAQLQGDISSVEVAKEAHTNELNKLQRSHFTEISEARMHGKKLMKRLDELFSMNEELESNEARHKVEMEECRTECEEKMKANLSACDEVNEKYKEEMEELYSGHQERFI